MKTHNQEHFYKYMNATRAIETLTTLATRWCSPLLYNDPFDTHFGMTFGFSLDEIPAAFSVRLLGLIQSDGPLPAQIPAKVAEAVRLGRLVRPHVGPDYYDKTILAAAAEGAERARQFVAKVNDAWELRLRIMRVFCVSEIHDNLLLWAHYADCHRGVALRLKCLPEKDTALCAAVPVTYSTKIPTLADRVDEWVEHAVGERRIDFSGTFRRLVFTKSDHWSYEKEWRCLTEDTALVQSAASLTSAQMIQENVLHPEEVSGLYLGCRISIQDRATLVGLAQKSFPHAEIFEANQSTTSFALEFKKI